MPFWSRNRSKSRPTRTPAPHAQRPELMDFLEPRLALYTSPFLVDLPTTAMMEHPENTVIRMQTSAGNIDIELYNRFGPGTAPPATGTANNFLRYINNGRLDGTFFHRLDDDFVLQGGGFSFNPDATGNNKTLNVETFAPIQNEFNTGRSNIARTIAMAKTNNPDSATSQFFFNIVNNSASLDNTLNSGGFTVFGRVIQGWDIITTINEDYIIRNLNQFMTGSASGAFGEVPLSGPNDTDLLTLVDVEVIKPANTNETFAHAVYFPDGFRSGNTTEVVDIVNLDNNASAVYQVIARYEGGTRDRVIATGTIEPGARLALEVAKARAPGVDLVRGGVAYAFEVRATQPIAASINRTDFDATAGESFISAGPLSGHLLQSWSFANGQKGPGLASFLTYQNLTDQPASITAIFTPESGAPFAITKIVQPYRRGGLNVNQLAGVPDGVYSVRLTSNNAIVAALSQFRAAPGRAATQTGQVGGASSQGVLPAAIIPIAGQSIVTLVYDGDSSLPITVSFDFVLSDGTVLHNNSPVTLSAATRRRALDLSVVNGAIPRGQFFTIRYTVQGGAEEITAGYTSVTNGDTVSTPFQIASTQEFAFGDGATDPTTGATGNEVLSLYNPFASVAMDYRISFHFTEGDLDEVVFPAAGMGTLAAGRRVDISVRSLTDIMTRLGMDAKYQRYSIRVSATPSGSGGPESGALFAQLNRFDSSGDTVTTGPTLGPLQTALVITDPVFGM